MVLVVITYFYDVDATIGALDTVSYQVILDFLNHMVFSAREPKSFSDEKKNKS